MSASLPHALLAGLETRGSSLVAWPSTELTATGAEFTGAVQNQGWGITARLKVPGAGEMTPYQPKYEAPATSR